MNMTVEVAELREMVIDGRLSRVEYEERLLRLLKECEMSRLSLQLETHHGIEDDRHAERKRAFLFGLRKRF